MQLGVVQTGARLPDCLENLNIGVEETFSENASPHHAGCSEDQDVHIAPLADELSNVGSYLGGLSVDEPVGGFGDAFDD